MTIPDPHVFEDAVGCLWGGRSADYALDCWAMAQGAAHEAGGSRARYYVRSWLNFGREEEEAFPSHRINGKRLTFGTRARQESRALFLTLMAELAERGEEAP